MKDSTPLSEERIQALVIQSQNGDSDAFGTIYDVFVQPIYRYVYFRVGPHEAEDLTELIFLKIWENIRQYKSANKSFASWMYRIAHNAVVDFYRANRPTDELPENMQDMRVDALADTAAHRHFDHDMLQMAMGKLKDRYRQILILKYINELSNEEIAVVMGKSQPALRILQFRALKSLKRIFENMGISSEDA